MNNDITSILTVTGLVMYIINYMTGWLIYFKIIRISKILHSIMYALLLIVLLALLIDLNFLSNKFLLYSVSFLLILVLPAGTKGGLYHIAVSTSGILLFSFTMLNYQFFKLIN
ncbi:MAG TPA: hypothetical protein PKE39_08420 [Ignavibacteria bacterium]|nr:hypothetical protein [Ignavibacteria bacterium]HMQ99033.1 hypothetical protein [Ignavibacteria bacterium]